MTDVVLEEVDQEDIHTPVAYETAVEIEIRAPRERVWKALTEEVGAWWSHTYRDDIVGVYLEPWPGGRFYEKFDEDGNGGLYATVTYAEYPSLIRYQGPMGMPGSQLTTGRFELIEQSAETTLMKFTGWVMGDIPDELMEERRRGGSEIYSSLVKYLEEGVKVR
ncbi:MAG: SRPBCC domain-containing protein [Acidimicrobiia bacterium]